MEKNWGDTPSATLTYILRGSGLYLFIGAVSQVSDIAMDLFRG